VMSVSEVDVSSVADVCANDALYCRRSLFVQAMKGVLETSRAVLPASVYQVLYRACFGAYKEFLCRLYWRNVAFRRLARDRAALSRALAVYRVMPYSLVGSRGLEATFDAASGLIAMSIPGDFVECGVAQGGCAALLAGLAATSAIPRKMWLFDSFAGLPDPTQADYDGGHRKTGKHIRPLVRGSCLGTRAQVESLLFSRFGFDPNRVLLVQGWFQDTLPAQKHRIDRIALLRIDGDWYESTMCCLRQLYDKVVPGGVVIVDDYGVCFGCKRAVHEFFDERRIRPTLVPDRRGGVRFEKVS